MSMVAGSKGHQQPAVGEVSLINRDWLWFALTD
jgi:hypothetical protein